MNVSSAPLQNEQNKFGCPNGIKLPPLYCQGKNSIWDVQHNITGGWETAKHSPTKLKDLWKCPLCEEIHEFSIKSCSICAISSNLGEHKSIPFEVSLEEAEEEFSELNAAAAEWLPPRPLSRRQRRRRPTGRQRKQALLALAHQPPQEEGQEAHKQMYYAVKLTPIVPPL